MVTLYTILRGEQPMIRTTELETAELWLKLAHKHGADPKQFRLVACEGALPPFFPIDAPSSEEYRQALRETVDPDFSEEDLDPTDQTRSRRWD